MSLVEHDMFGKFDKVKTAIERIKNFEPEEGYYLAYSGGKDSTCLLALAKMAGVKFDVHYNVTTVDPPELLRFILQQFDTVIYDRTKQGRQSDIFTKTQEGKLIKTEEKYGRVITFDIPRENMHDLIIKEKFPPTRIQRYCCKKLKEAYGTRRVTMTGVRWAESRNRKRNQGIVNIFDDKKQSVEKAAYENGAAYRKAKRGVLLNLDNDTARRTVEMCYRTKKTLVNPIIDWTDEDVWEFIKNKKLQYCSLYDEGWNRIGCVGCPMGGTVHRKQELKRWPQYKKLYLDAFGKMIKAQADAGNFLFQDSTPEDVMDWWISGKRWNNDAGMLELINDDED